MSKFRIINLLDKLFIAFSIFLLIYAWINFYVRDLMFTFVLSVIFSLSSTHILFYFITKKQATKKQKNNTVNNMNKCFLAFRLMPIKSKLNLLNQIFANDCESKITKNVLTYKKDNETHSIISATDLQKLTQDDLITLIEKHEIATQHLEIVCAYHDDVNLNFLNNIEIKLIDKETLFGLFCQHNIYPDCSNINEHEIKVNWKMIAKNILHENKSKKYFWCGFILIFSSLILPYKTYYLIFGSLFLLCSILCKILPKFKK